MGVATWKRATPIVGTCYLVGSAPSGEWADYPNHLVSFTQGGWRFIAPRDGMTVHVLSSGTTAVYRETEWEVGTLTGSEVVIDGQKVLGMRGFAIAAPSGGGTVDVEARAAIGQILLAIREHGLIEI